MRCFKYLGISQSRWRERSVAALGVNLLAGSKAGAIGAGQLRIDDVLGRGSTVGAMRLRGASLVPAAGAGPS